VHSFRLIFDFKCKYDVQSYQCDFYTIFAKIG
jgi:hypothetical protein